LKTIVFHSYKGGVGRTLLLANFAVALARLKKRVVMLDFDFDSPGLPFKFALENRINKGYVDYLVNNKLKRYKKNYFNECTQFIKNIFIKIPGESNLWLIPAGNTKNKDYWKNIASDKFNKSFYFTESLTKGMNYNLQSLSNNIQSFINDKEMIQNVFNPDFFLIDAKSGSERASVSLFLWADIVVSMFTNNKEELFGTALVHRSLLNDNDLPQSLQKKRQILPVLCRTPESVEHFSMVRQKVKKIFMHNWRELNTPDCELPEPNTIWDNLLILSENRNWMTNERPLLKGDGSKSEVTQLSLNYFELFSHIFSLSIDDFLDSILSESKIEFPNIVDRYFEVNKDIGQLINPEDREPNIALRIKTLHYMFSSLIEKTNEILKLNNKTPEEIDTSIAGILYYAGEKSGDSFGSKLMTPNIVWEKIPVDIDTRLKEWCRFDSSVGFGNITFKQRADNSSFIDILIKANSFYLEGSMDNCHDLNEFLRGYIAGVVKWIVFSNEKKAEVKKEKVDKDLTIFSFSTT